MSRSAALCFAEPPGVAGTLSRTFGLSHCGLECDRGGGQAFYVTWDGSVRGADLNSAQRKATMFATLPAHRRVGFTDISAPSAAAGGNRIVANPFAFDGADALDSTTDFVDPRTQQPRPFLRKDIPVRAAGGVAFQADDHLFGLDLEAIWAWWFQILILDPADPRRSYCKVATMGSRSTNCCGMVGRALQQGGLGAYAAPPTNIFYQGSASLLRWVEKASRRIDALNTQRRSIMASVEYAAVQPFNDGNQAADFHGFCDLPSLEDWKRRSAVQEGFRTGFARRKEQIAEIDRLLPLYHAARAAAHGHVAATPVLQQDQAPADTDWMSLMTQIHDQCFRHLAEKPTSDRRRAVLGLVKTIHDALRGYAWQAEDDTDSGPGQTMATTVHYGWR